jgi:exonuclease III
MKPGRYKAVENRRRQWALLGAMAPDIALLQECRPDDLHQQAPPWMAEEYSVVGVLPDRWIACSAILVRKTLRPSLPDSHQLPEPEARWLEYLSGYVARAQVDLGWTQLAVASVHAIAKEVTDPALSDSDHEIVRRRSLSRAWHNDLAAAALAGWVGTRPFIVGGDWNNALLFDATYPSGMEGEPGASAEFFTTRETGGWHHALRKFHPEAVRTYLDPASAAYELDHIFSHADVHSRLAACHVVADPSVATLSDHAPLVADFCDEPAVLQTG